MLNYKQPKSVTKEILTYIKRSHEVNEDDIYIYTYIHTPARFQVSNQSIHASRSLRHLNKCTAARVTEFTTRLLLGYYPLVNSVHAVRPEATAS